MTTTNLPADWALEEAMKMNAPQFIPTWRNITSWSERLEAVRGTHEEQAALMTIAAEAKDNYPKIWEAAYDAANPCDDGVYQDAIGDLEYLLKEFDTEGPYEELNPRYVEYSSFGMHHPDNPAPSGWWRW